MHRSAKFLPRQVNKLSIYRANLKQAADKFTKDAFDAPRCGRPPLLNPKSNAQRQREFKARVKAALRSTDTKALAKAHQRQVKAMSSSLSAMSADWGDLDEYLRSTLNEASILCLFLSEQLGELAFPVISE